MGGDFKFSSKLVNSSLVITLQSIPHKNQNQITGGNAKQLQNKHTSKQELFFLFKQPSLTFCCLEGIHQHQTSILGTLIIPIF